MNADKRGYSMRCLYSPSSKRVNGLGVSMAWFICVNLRSSAVKRRFRFINAAGYAWFSGLKRHRIALALAQHARRAVLQRDHRGGLKPARAGVDHPVELVFEARAGLVGIRERQVLIRQNQGGKHQG